MSKVVDDRFGGVARLYGQAAMDRFANARVMIVGIGGVGSWAAEALARSGIGHLTLVDMDEICVTNVNRQIHALTGQIGRAKTTAMAERIHAINPNCDVQEHPQFFNRKTADAILAGSWDGIIDAIDTMQHKALLLAMCRERQLQTVTSGGAGGKQDPTRIRVADLAFTGKDPLLHQLRRLLRQEHHFPKGTAGSNPEPWGIDAVFSDESSMLSPCAVEAADDVRGRGRLNCTTGYGTATHVTASFGLIAAGQLLNRLANPS